MSQAVPRLCAIEGRRLRRAPQAPAAGYLLFVLEGRRLRRASWISNELEAPLEVL